MIAPCRAFTRRVGLLPSNARLGPEHSPRLQRLLDYLALPGTGAMDKLAAS